MKIIMPFFLLLLLSACDKPVEKTANEPQFFFHWDQENKLGACMNKQGVDGHNAKFIGPCGDLRGYELAVGALDGVDLRGAMLDGMSLKGFSLNGTDLTAAFARGTSFDDSKMNGIKLTHGHFEGSTFRGAELNGADLQEAHLSGANLRGASLFGANFSMADLAGAKLPKKLHTTLLKNSRITFGTQLPFDHKVAKSRGMREGQLSHSSDIGEPNQRLPSATTSEKSSGLEPQEK